MNTYFYLKKVNCDNDYIIIVNGNMLISYWHKRHDDDYDDWAYQGKTTLLLSDFSSWPRNMITKNELSELLFVDNL